MKLLQTLAHRGVAPALILALTALQLVYAAHLPLHGDEAYYWAWSQHPALSYFDHPPMIAWLLALTTAFGASELAVRVVPALCMGLSTWFIYRLTLEIYGHSAAILALLVFVALPVTQMGALLATPDAPVVLFWSLGLYASYQAIFSARGVWFLGAGAAIGLALLSKYTAILFPAALFAFLLLRRRDLFLRGSTWRASLLGVAVFFPVLLWNAQHDWISFLFQYRHGSSSEGRLHWGTWFEFLAGIFLAFSPPLLFVALVAALGRRTWRDERRLFVALFLLLPLAFFLYKGLYKKMEPNWVAIAYPAAAVMAAGSIVERRLWKTLGFGLAMALALSLLIKFPVELGLPAKWNIQNRLVGDREAIADLLRLRRPGESLLADHYTTASLLGFYAPDHPVVGIPTPTRFSQYDLWSSPSPHPRGLYLACEDRGSDLKSACGSATLLKVYHFEQPGYRGKDFYFYRCGP